MNRVDVALPEQRIKIDEPIAEFFLLLRLADDVVIDHVCAEGRRQRRDLFADVSQSQHADRLALYHKRAAKVFRARPMPRAQLTVDLQQIAIARQHQHDRQLRHNAGIDARTGRNRNSALAPRLEIHMVKPRAPALPEFDVRGVVDDIRVDIQSGNQIFAVRQIAVGLRRERVHQFESLRHVFVQRVVGPRKVNADEADFLRHVLSPFHVKAPPFSTERRSLLT